MKKFRIKGRSLFVQGFNVMKQPCNFTECTLNSVEYGSHAPIYPTLIIFIFGFEDVPKFTESSRIDK